jgi:lantibiotic leader peptide-processing serine protease
MKGYFATGIGYQSWIVDGIVTAADDGVHVINMSLGGWRFMNEPGGAAAYVAYLRATQYAQQRGALVVAASGNSGLDLTKVRPAFNVPSGTPAAMSINATGPDDSLAFYSNYGGSETRVVGPGGDVSTPPFSYCLSAYSPLNAWAPGAGWVFSIGTSMAAPKVAGVAALVYAQNPGISPQQVQARLMQTAEPIGDTGFSAEFGHGMAHAYRALTILRR